MDNLNNDADVIIIGSGFAGSVAAARLTQAGQSVIVLERGPWRDTEPVRGAGIRERKPLPSTGGMLGLIRSLRLPKGPKKGLRLNKYGYLELWVDKGIKVPCTSNVGGGSHIWAAVIERPPSGFWDGMAEGVSDQVMAPHYDQVSTELKAMHPSNLADVPNHPDHIWQGVDYFTPMEPGEQPPLGIYLPEADPHMAQSCGGTQVSRHPTNLADDSGLFGSPSGAKSTVDALYLIPALQRGLQVKDMHEVTQVSSRGEGGYEIFARDLRGGKELTLRAPQVMLCAGTMNTNALLFNSRDAGGLSGLDALGQGFGTNGDVMGTWPSDGRDSVLGTPSHGRIKIKGCESEYIMQGSGIVPPLPSFLRKKARKSASESYTVVAMGVDAADGKIWSDNGRIRMSYDKQNSDCFKKVAKAFETLTHLSGRKVEFDDQSVVTAHPLGGCRIADNRQEGCVNGYGEVYGHPGLYVADASIFPRPTGVPPSLSIAAWASHVATSLLKQIT